MRSSLRSILPLFSLLLLAKFSAAQWIYVENNVKVHFQYNLEGTETDTTLNTSLTVEDGENGLTIDYGDFAFNNENIRNQEALSALLSDACKNMTAKYGTGTLQKYTGYIEKMVNEIAEKLEDRQLRSLVYQSLCIYQTLSRAPVRDKDHCGNVPFTVMESYLNGLTAFSVEEDEYINIAGFKEFLRKLSGQQENEGITYYLEALKDETAEELNVVQITERLQAYFNSTRSARWPQGGQCGCCGNYNGPCLYWNKICLLHDYQCQTCTPRWYCLSGCVPSSCSGNTISWYWWLL